MIINAKTTGLLALLGGVALFSTVEVATKIIGENALPFQMVFILMGFSALFGSLMIFPFAFVSAIQHGINGLVESWLPVLYVTLAGTTLAYGLYYFGLRHCTAFQASMMFFLKPVLASVFAAVILKEHINSFMISGSLLILSGLAVTVGSHLKTRS